MKVYKGKKLVCEGRTARDPLSKAWGWMLHRPKKWEGLLFVWDFDIKPPMWMPLMLEPINMAFLNEGGVVVDFVRAEPMTLNPLTWRIYSPKRGCRMVLELHKDNKLRVGDKLRIEP